jgi:hypothetical protein
MMGSGADGRGEAGYLEKPGVLCSDGAGLFVLITARRIIISVANSIGLKLRCCVSPLITKSYTPRRRMYAIYFPNSRLLRSRGNAINRVAIYEVVRTYPGT